MKRIRIEELAHSVAESGGISDGGVKWMLNNLSRKDLKLFLKLLKRKLGEGKVTASFAGNISGEDEKRIKSLFPGKSVEFRRDDGLGAGLKLEYGDFVLDYSVSGIVKRILNGIRESL